MDDQTERRRAVDPLGSADWPVDGGQLMTDAIYIASKAGVEGLVHVLATELRGRNITVDAVAPGPVATELF